MKRLLCSTFILVLSLALAGGLNAQAAASPTPAIQNGGETAAKASADVWLALVDDGRYEPGYEAAAGIFQRIISKEQWIKLATAGRGVMGKTILRAFKDSKFTATMPGAPDGQYVVIHYDVRFEKKAAAIETVTMLLDTDGQWKVCGYFIR